MRAPDSLVAMSDGSTSSLQDLAAEGPIGLVFLRHIGCIFCRKQVALLRGLPPGAVVFVGMELPEALAEFCQRLRSPHRFASDPERKLYNAFGVGTGTIGQVLGPRVLVKGLGALRYGNGRPTSDPMQLGAAFVIARDGSVAWSHRARDAADLVSAAALADALAAA